MWHNGGPLDGYFNFHKEYGSWSIRVENFGLATGHQWSLLTIFANQKLLQTVLKCKKHGTFSIY
jgi:hypothetical protein